MNRIRWLACILVLVCPVAGCEDEDDRVAEVAREAAQRQAEQNKQMAQLQNQVAEGSRRLVEAEAQARSEILALQRDLQQSQAEIGRQRDQLEVERRQIASQRYWDAIFGESISAAVILLACMLPLLLCWALLRRPSHDDESDTVLAEFLVQELSSDAPILLPERSVPHLLETGSSQQDQNPLDPNST